MPRRSLDLQGAHRMNQPGKKLQPKLSLDMSFDEALARYAQTDPDELKETAESSKEAAKDGKSATPPPRERVRPKKNKR